MQQQLPVDSAFGEFRPLSRRNPPTRAAPMTEPIQRTGGSSYASVLKKSGDCPWGESRSVDGGGPEVKGADRIET